jgi:hypothetical protein
MSSVHPPSAACIRNGGFMTPPEQLVRVNVRAGADTLYRCTPGRA